MQVFELINELEKKRHEKFVSRDSIEFISMLCRIIKPVNTLEIGTFIGYSALWLSVYSKNVITIDNDHINADIARNNFNKAGIKNITLIEDDALVVLDSINEKFDVIFIDGMKIQYKLYLEKCLNILNDDGIIFVDNTISHKDKLSEFFEYLQRIGVYYQELNIGKGLIVISKIH